MNRLVDADISLLFPKPGAQLPPELPKAPVLIWVAFNDDAVPDWFYTLAQARDAVAFFATRPAPSDRQFARALAHACAEAEAQLRPSPGPLS